MTGTGNQADVSPRAVSRSLLLFQVADMPLASDAAQIEHVHDSLPIERVDGTRRWFSGLAVADGQLLPVTDLGALVGKPASAGQTLQLHRRIGIGGILVERVMGIHKLCPAHVRHRPLMPSPLAAATGDMGVTHEGRVHYLFDLHALFHSPHLMDVSDGA